MTDVSVAAPQSVAEVKPRMALQGVVKRIELYGAFVDVGIGVDALLHISQLGKPNVRNVGDVVQVGESLTVYVIKADAESKKVAVSLVQPPAVTWEDLKEGMRLTGKVIRIENFGAFVDIGAERAAMIHVSELSDNYVKSPTDVVQIGQEIEGRIIKINRKERKIDMSLKMESEPIEMNVPASDEDELPSLMEVALRNAASAKEGGNDRREKRERDIRDKRRREQDDIIARTLRGHAE